MIVGKLERGIQKCIHNNAWTEINAEQVLAIITSVMSVWHVPLHPP